MSSFRVLNLRYLRRQPLRAVLAIVAVAAAVGGAVASFVLIASLDKSFEDALRGLAGPAPLRVVGPLARGGLHPSIVEKVEETEGVRDAVPMVQAVAIAQELGEKPVHIVALGMDCRIEALVGTFGCENEISQRTTVGPLITSPALLEEAGAKADVRTDVGRVPIAGAVLNDSLDEINGGRVAVFDLETAQRVFDRGANFDAVYVRPDDGTSVAVLRSRLERVIGPTNMVLDGDSLAPWMANRGPLIPLLTLALVIGLGISALLIYNIMSLALAGRRRDLAIASSIGTSPRLLTAGIVGEAALLGLAGAIVGIPAGWAAAQPLVGSFASSIFEQGTGISVSAHMPVTAPIVGVLVGVLLAAAASFVPARRALRLDLAAELHGRAVLDEDAPKRAWVRALVLLGFLAVAVALSTLAQRNAAIERWQPPAGAAALGLAVFFGVAFTGAIAPLLIRSALRVAPNTAGPLRVAMANLVSRPGRVSGIATTVSAAVGAACILGALIPATKATITGGAAVGPDEFVSVSTLPFNNSANIDARPSRELVAKLERLPGVQHVWRSFAHEVTDTEGVYGLRSFELFDGTLKPVMGDVGPDVLEGGQTLIGSSLARQRGLRPGSTLKIATPTGFVGVRVAGIWINSYDNGYNATISAKLFRELFGDVTPHAVLVESDGEVTAAELADRIAGARLDPDARAMTSSARTDSLAEEIIDQGAPFWGLQRMLLGIALVGTLSTLLLLGVQRRRELGVLGAVGFSPLALGRLTLFEAVAAGLAGSVLGIIGSLPQFEVLRNASAVSLGVRTAYVFSPGSALVATVIAIAVVAVGASLPAWRAARVQIVEAIRDE